MTIGFEQYDEQIAAIRIQEIERQLSMSEVSNEALKEAYSDAVRQMFAMEDVGWQLLGGYNAQGPGNDLEQAKGIASKLKDVCYSNPLLKRGNEIRNSYLFSEPYEIGTEGAESKISRQQENIINKPQNQAAVFALGALEEIESQHFHAGIQFTQWDRTKKEFQQIPFEEIADVIYDPLNKSELRYVKRVVDYTLVNSIGRTDHKRYEAWIPVSNYTPETGRFLRRIDKVEVDTSKRMVVTRVNRDSNGVFGIPDAFAAAPWALAYSAYLRDGTKVLAALAEWVWKITPSKKNAAERAAASIKANRGAGGSLLTDMDVQALPKADAVDLNTGRPLASQVAAALGISIVVLLADPGQSGAFGTAQTLADPNRRTMQARREVNTEFLKECLRLVGIADPTIIWAKMAPGTDKEETELVTQIWGTGLFSPEEIRPRLAKIGQITVTSEDAPEGVMIPNNMTAQLQVAEQTAKFTAQQNDDGSNSQTNGVGRDNRGQGPVSRTRTSRTQAGATKTSE